MYLLNLFGISRLFMLYRSQSLLQFVTPFAIPSFNIPQQLLRCKFQDKKIAKFQVER